MKSACFSLLVFREQWKCWIVYRGLIKCGQQGHVPAAKCWPPPPASPQPTHSCTVPCPTPVLAPTVRSLPHASSYRLLWLHICVWNVLILTFHCCSALQRPLLSKTLLSSLTSRSCNLLDTVTKNSLGWIPSAQTMLIPILEHICISFVVWHYRKS